MASWGSDGYKTLLNTQWVGVTHIIMMPLWQRVFGPLTLCFKNTPGKVELEHSNGYLKMQSFAAMRRIV